MSGPILEAQNLGITEYINSGNYNLALKHSETLLGRFPHAPYSHALKALALAKLNKFEDALSSSMQARNLFFKLDANQIDDVTLKAMQMIFTRIGRFDLATECYKYACENSPSNAERWICLFNCHVREYSFVKQQQVAMKLYNSSHQEMYLLWAVCSILLQVYCADQPKEILLSLAEALIKRHLNSYSLREPEALMVYIFVLEKLSKFMEAFEILSGESGSIMVFEFDKLRIQGRLLARGGEYARAAGIYEDALKLCPDDWECFLHYIGCLLDDASTMCMDADDNPVYPPKSVDCKNLKLTDEQFDSCISRASNFISDLLRHESNIALRGPHLANLEIERMKLEYGKGNIDKLAEGVAHYYWRFGGLSCFISDIESFLAIIESHGKNGIWDEIITKHQRASLSPTTNNLQQGVALFKIQIHHDKLFTMRIDGLYMIALEMMRTYFRGLPHSRSYDIQEVMNCEELLSMISNVLVQLFWRTQEIGYLLESIMILEFGLSIRSLIWQYKILLLHLYSFWGCLPMAYEWYKSLDVKNILLESVLHHILPQMLVSPLWSNLSDLLGGYLGFMDEYLKESGDMTIFAYRHKNYSKVVEFVKFKQRLERSSQFWVAKIESAILKLKKGSSSIQDVEGNFRKLECGKPFVALSDEIEMTPRTFNEDFDIRPWWTPTPNKNCLLGPFEANYLAKEIMIDNTKASVLKAIRKRSLIPRMIYLSLQCASSSVKEHTEELKLLLEQYARLLDYPFQEAVELIFEVSNGEKSLEILSLNMVDWMNFVVFLNAWNLTSHELEETKPSTWNLINSLLNMYIRPKVRSMGPLISSPCNDLPELVQLVTEPFTWHRLIIQSCARASHPTGKQKKKGGAVGQNTFLRRQEIQDSVRSLHGAIDEVSQWLRQQNNESKTTRSEAILSSLRKNEPQDSPHPGGVLSELEVFISSLKEADIGDRIFKSLQSWSAAGVVKKLVAGQDTVISEFLEKCQENTRLLQDLILRK